MDEVVEETPDEIEERQREQERLKQEALREEEERKDKMKQLLSGYLELKTKKEIEKATANEKKIVAQWLHPFRAAQLKEWQIEFEKLKVSFQRALDHQLATIRALQKEHEQADVQQLWADSLHLRVTEELFDFMKVKAEELKQQYLEDLESVKKYYLEREQLILSNCRVEEERVKTLAFLRRSIRESCLKQTRGHLKSFQVQEESMKQREIVSVQNQYDHCIEGIWRALQSAVLAYEQSTSEDRVVFKEWKHKYDASLQSLSTQQKEMEMLNQEVLSIEKKILAEQKKLEKFKQEAKWSHEGLLKELNHLENISQSFRSIGPNFRRLISQSEAVIPKLKVQSEMASKILKINEFCEHLETSHDVKYVETQLLSDNERATLKKNDCLDFVRDLYSEDLEDISLLENLYRRSSCVILQNSVLRREIRDLQIHNMSLRNGMDKFLERISKGNYKKFST